MEDPIGMLMDNHCKKSIMQAGCLTELNYGQLSVLVADLRSILEMRGRG